MVQSVMPSVTVPFPLNGGGNNGNIGGGSNGTMSNQRSQVGNEECGIREVWAYNLEDEFVTIRHIINHYPYVAMVSNFNF